jgi:hypothetical protein
MTSYRLTLILLLVGCVLLSQFATVFAAAPIQFAAQNAELAISEISVRTLRIELAPLDEHGRPRPAQPSTVLVPCTAPMKQNKPEHGWGCVLSAVRSVMLTSSRKSPPSSRVTSLRHRTVTRGWTRSRSTR